MSHLCSLVLLRVEVRRVTPSGNLRKPITTNVISTVRAMLMNGQKQEKIATLVGISQPSVARIKAQMNAADLPKKLPHPDSRAPAQDKWSADTMEFLSLPDIMQERIFTLVNKERERQGDPLIPWIAPEYKAFMNSSIEDQVFENRTLEEAKAFEDRRISAMYNLWTEILQQSTATAGSKDIYDILSRTERPFGEVIAVIQDGETELHYNSLPWEHVLDKASRVKVVKEILIINRPALIEACCIVFYSLRNSQISWGADSTRDQIFDVADKLEKWPSVMEKIEEKYNADIT